MSGSGDERIRIVIADDHAIVRRGLRVLLAAAPQFELVGEAGDGPEAVAQVCAHRPDVVLLDIMMPRMTGDQVIGVIQREAPGTRILVLTNYADDNSIFSATASDSCTRRSIRISQPKSPNVERSYHSFPLMFGPRRGPFQRATS